MPAAPPSTDIRVTEEASNGRTTVFDDPLEPGRNGKTYLQPCLESQRPLELVILMLDTNDLKHRFGLSAFESSEGIWVLAELVLLRNAGPDEGEPQLLLVAPPPLNPAGLGRAFVKGAEKSRDLAHLLLKTRTAVLNNELENTLRQCLLFRAASELRLTA